MKKFLLLIILNLSLLFSPPPRQGSIECMPYMRYIHITRFAGFPLNPDTYGYIFPSVNPGLLLKKNSQRQSRPLFIIAGSIFGYALYYITWPAHRLLYGIFKAHWTGAYPESLMYDLGTFYISYVFINMLILWFSLYLFEKIFIRITGQKKNVGYSMYFMMVFIVSNPVTKAFFWTVHQQMFAFFTPLLCIYIMLRLNDKQDLISYPFLMRLAFGSGILLLVYGNFLLLLPVLLFCFSSNYFRFAGSLNRGGLIFKNLLLILLFVIPTLLWMLILKLNGVSYYSLEIAYYRQLIWIKDSLSVSASAFFQALQKNTMAYFSTMRYFICSLAAAGAIVAIMSRFKLPEQNNTKIIKGIAFVLLCFFCFYWMLGFYEERLTYTLIPVLLCLVIAFCRDSFHQKKMTYILCGLALTWHIYVLLSYGPFC